MCKIATSVGAIQSGTFHRLNAEVEVALKSIIGERKLFGSSTDHNQWHLNNAVGRDAMFKYELEQVLKNQDREVPIVIVYEREPLLFQVTCSCYAAMPGSCVLRGNQYVALLRRVVLYETEQPEEAICVTMYRYKK